MRRRSSQRRILVALAACLAFQGATLLGVSPAGAAVSLSVTPDVPADLVVGTTVPSTMTVANANSAAEAGLDDTLTQITLVPSCTGARSGSACAPPDVLADALVPSPAGTGRAGTACAGVPFAITLTDIVARRYDFSWPGSIVLTPAGPTRSCTVDFTTDVVSLPREDGIATVAAPGLQIEQLAGASATAPGATSGFDVGGDEATIRAPLALSARATPSALTLGESFQDVATLGPAGATPPVTGAVSFDVYGPDDPTCAGTPELKSTNAVRRGAATSDAFQPSATGTYRVIARHPGDAVYLASSTACDDPAQTVVVSPGTPGPLRAGAPPRIVATVFETAPRVGDTSVLRVDALDRVRPVRGLQVGFGEAGGRAGSSACSRPRAAPSAKPVRLRADHTFGQPGRHRVAITVLAGGCGSAVRTQTSIVVNVSLQATAPPPSRSSCKDATLLPTFANLARVTAAVVCLVNAERRRAGLASLRHSATLALAARGHSRDMVRRQYFEHDAPGGPTFAQRARRAGYRGFTLGENIHYEEAEAAARAVREWMLSPGHRANILRRRYRFAGVGVARGLPVQRGALGATYTQYFGATAR